MEQRMTALEICMARLETKLDELIRQSEPRGLDVETRIRQLEAARWWVGGMATALGAALGWMGPYIFNH